MLLSTVCEANAWVWAVSGRPGHDELAVGCDDGAIQVYKLQFRNVTAIYEVQMRRREVTWDSTANTLNECYAWLDEVQ